MPICSGVQFVRVPQKVFHSIDFEIMEIAFSIHREFGNLCDEKIYHAELAHRCRAMGFECVRTEVPIQVSCKCFEKTYFIDLLVNDSVLYELKSVSALAPSHRMQVLHYLMLTGLGHGKLLNFGTSSMQYEFVSTRLTPPDRHEYRISADAWLGIDPESVKFRGIIQELITAWGLFLDIGLFYEATSCLLGSGDDSIRSVALSKQGRQLGRQKLHLLNDSVAFRITALKEGYSSCLTGIRKFLRLTDLKAVQWVNLSNHEVTFRTVLRS